MKAFEAWCIDNKELLEENDIPTLVAERIFNAGIITERNHILELIQEGVLTIAEHD